MAYRVLSPDGFDIERDAEYRTLKEAREALKLFISRFTIQGFYSTGNRERIPVADLAECCVIIPS